MVTESGQTHHKTGDNSVCCVGNNLLEIAGLPIESYRIWYDAKMRENTGRIHYE